MSYTIEVESLNKFPNIRLVRHEGKYRIFNAETGKYLIQSYPGGTSLQWSKTMTNFDWDKVNISSWDYLTAKTIVADLYGN